MITFFERKCMMFAFWFIVSSGTISAQSKTYTLNELIEASRRYLPALMQKQALISSANAGIKDARNAALPSVKIFDEVNIGSANSLAGSTLPMGPVISTTGSIRATESLAAATGNVATLYSEYELLNFGLNKARVHDAQAAAALSQSDYDRELYLLKVDIARQYFLTLRYQYQQRIDQQNIERYQSLFGVIQALTKSGIKPGADSSLALAELSKARVTYNQVSSQARQSTERLSLYTGIPEIQIHLDTSAAKSGGLFPVMPDSGYMNPLISFYENQKRVLEADETLIRKSYLPKFLLAGAVWGRGSSISGSDKYESLVSGLGYQRFNYAAGLSFIYNLVDIAHMKDKLAVQRFKVAANDYALQQQHLNLRSASRQADINIQTIQDNLSQLNIQTKSAQDVYGQKVAQYRAGLVNLIDLTNAAFVLYRSQTDYIESVNDWNLSKLDKAAATGSLDSFIQSIK